MFYERVFPRFRPRHELRPRGRSAPAGTASAPGAGGEWAFRLSWLGTAGFVVESREATILIDPFLSRPGPRGLVRPLDVDEATLRRHLPARVDAVLCGHSHYDHAADAPRIARLTGAKLVGSESTCAWGLAEGLDERSLVRVGPRGATVRVGDVEIRFIPSKHGKLLFGRVPFPGFVHGVPRAPAPFWRYRMGGAYGILLETRGASLYHNGSADLVDAELEGARADVLIAGLAGRKGTDNYVARLTSTLAPSLVIPTHHDAFFAPLERGLHLLPGVDLDGFVSEVRRNVPRATLITPLYHEPIVVPPGDARGAFLDLA